MCVIHDNVQSVTKGLPLYHCIWRGLLYQCWDSGSTVHHRMDPRHWLTSAVASAPSLPCSSRRTCFCCRCQSTTTVWWLAWVQRRGASANQDSPAKPGMLLVTQWKGVRRPLLAVRAGGRRSNEAVAFAVLAFVQTCNSTVSDSSLPSGSCCTNGINNAIIGIFLRAAHRVERNTWLLQIIVCLCC